MITRAINKFKPNQQGFLDLFTKACQQDDRIIAAFLAGSYARGAADEYSDLDLGLITTDEDFDDFSANLESFISRLGEPLFLEDFGLPNIVFYIFENGVEGELGIRRASQFAEIHTGPYQILLDKRDLLTGVAFHGKQPDPKAQTEKLRRLLTSFWHEWLHFISALGRGQLWWAQGQVEVLRGYCVSLARMHSDFFDEYIGEEPYFKIDEAITLEQLSALQPTFGPMERGHLHKAGKVIVQVFRELALPLAQVYELPYPEALERMMAKRLEELD
jgi:predicted nucleotidyltransferase